MNNMAGPDVVGAMREDWNRRAREDANYYVAFGRRNQPEDEFFASGADQIRLFETELKRRPAEFWSTATALEIGCGPGRLLRPLSRHFARLHGLDISDEMLRRAAENLRGITNVSLHHASSSSLAEFASGTIDFIYSYAVFQHIPSHAVVFNYISEAVRTLAPGGLFCFQINGLSSHDHVPTTWAGCRVSAEEIVDFARRHNVLLLALTDKDTQYMWVTLQKPFPSPPATPPLRTEIFQVTNAYTGEPVVPVSGRFGAASVWLTGLPAHADLLSLQARVDGVEAYCSYVSPPTNGRRFLNIIIPAGTRTGLVPVEVLLHGQPLGRPARARIIPPAPKIPSVSYIADGINLLSTNRIESGCVKLTMDEVPDPSNLRLTIDGHPIPYDFFCVNPLHERYEFNFRLPPGIGAGPKHLDLAVGGKQFAPLAIRIEPTPET